MYQHNSILPGAWGRGLRADCLGAAVRWTTRTPAPGHLELPPALVRDRTAARRPRPRDAAAHRGPDGALLAPGHGGIRARDRHAGHHLLHPPGDPADARTR